MPLHTDKLIQKEINKHNYMNNRTLLFVVAASLGCLNAVAGNVYDGTNDDKDISKTINLNPVVVTGNGHHQLLKSTTTPVHVLSQQAIKEAGTTDFQDVLTKLMPQVSFSPNAMGSYIRVNGLGNKYVLVLVNGKKMIGDIAGNVDLSRINMSKVKRIEVLDGAASALYGSDAIGGVINIITDEKTMDKVVASSDTRLSGKGQFSEGVNLDVTSKYLDSHTSYFHQEADSYQNNNMAVDADGKEYETIAPLFIGFNSNVINQRFDINPAKNLSMYAGGSYSYKLTDRPNSRKDITGGSDYDMRSEGWRWEAGAKYNMGKHSVLFDFINDNYHYGNLYQVATNTYDVGDFVRNKSQKYYEAELKGVFHFYDNATTIIGADWRNDFLTATSGNVNNNVYTLAGYVQHDMEIVKNVSATLGMRYTKHGTFGNNFTPKVALMYAPGKFRFRAAYSRGFRAPGLDELYYHYFKMMGKRPVITFGNTNLKAESSNYVSLSAEYSNKFLTLSVMGYMNFVDNMIVKENITIDDAARTELAQQFPEATADQLAQLKKYGHYINSNKGVVRGLQANATVSVTNDISLIVNYAYTNGRSKNAGTWTALERTFKNSLTAGANYNHTWRNYTLGVNLNGRFQSATYYPGYENAPGYGVINLNTTHTFTIGKMFKLVPSVGIDNIFNKTDHRTDTPLQKVALYSPGKMLVVGLKVNFAK